MLLRKHRQAADLAIDMFREDGDRPVGRSVRSMGLLPSEVVTSAGGYLRIGQVLI